MAGAGMRRAARSGYTAAGYAFGETQERDLYIERIQAGSAQDMLRDNNRPGYAAEALDADGLPFSFFEEENQREERRVKTTVKKHRKLTPTKRLERAWRRERGAVALCCALLLLNIVLLSFYGQAMIDGVRKQNQIQMYTDGAEDYDVLIGDAQRKIAAAQDGMRIRNIAQNEMGMLRKERVASETIYIQTTNLAANKPMVQVAQEDGGLLDWLLSVADIFDFMS